MEVNLSAVTAIYNKRKLVKLTGGHSLFNEGDIKTLKKETKTTLIRVLKSSMEASTEASKVTLNTEVNTALNRKKKGNLVTAKVYSKNKNELPAYHVFSRVPWLGQHETGGTVKNIIIPNISKDKPKRMRRKTLKNILDTLSANKKLYIERSKGTQLFYGTYDRETSKLLKDFKYLLPADHKLKDSNRVLIAFKFSKATNKKLMKFSQKTDWQIEELRKEFFSQLEKE